jgi:hypothetical protein
MLKSTSISRNREPPPILPTGNVNASHAPRSLRPNHLAITPIVEGSLPDMRTTLDYRIFRVLLPCVLIARKQQVFFCACLVWAELSPKSRTGSMLSRTLVRHRSGARRAAGFRALALGAARAINGEC